MLRTLLKQQCCRRHIAYETAVCHNPSVHSFTGDAQVLKAGRKKAEPRVPESSAFEVEMAIDKLKDTNHQVLIRSWQNCLKHRGEQFALRSVNLVLLFKKQKELTEEWIESIIVPIYKKGDKTGCSNYRGILLLPATYKILSNILLSRLTPYSEVFIGDHRCEF